VTPTLTSNFSGGPYALGSQNTSLSSFTVWNNNAYLLGFNWIAIGY